MNPLYKIAQQLIAPKKGILAADESSRTITKRFTSLQVESTEESRRAYREMLFTTQGIDSYISGVIMYDETIRQSTQEGISFVQLLKQKGIIPGIKVDEGTREAPNSPQELITEGLDGLENRLKEYYSLGAEFAKWRALFLISENTPSRDIIKRNAYDLAVYAKMCQKNNLVPIVEPEVLMTGKHDIAKCFSVTKRVLKQVFRALKKEHVDFMGLLLKPNMVLAGEEWGKNTPEDVAKYTIKCLKKVVPEDVPGIVFLSGGQTETQACENLNAIQLIDVEKPWELSFSYGRALQTSALEEWRGSNNNVEQAQKIFLAQARHVSEAREGIYNGK